MSVDERVSVVIPTYNRAGYVGATIRSVLDQTHRSLEVLVADDGSTDETRRVVEAIADDRVVYLAEPHRGQPAATRNAALARATGSLIAFVDDDDLWLPEKLAHQIERLRASPEAGLCYSDTYRFRDDPAVPGRRFLGPRGGPEGDVFGELYGWNFVASPTAVIRRSVIDAVGVFDEDTRVMGREDYEYWLRIAHRFPFAYVDRPLALYRVVGEKVSESLDFRARGVAFVGIVDERYPEASKRYPAKQRSWLALEHAAYGEALLREGRLVEARAQLRASLSQRSSRRTRVFWSLTFLGRRLALALLDLAGRFSVGRWLPQTTAPST